MDSRFQLSEGSDQHCCERDTLSHNMPNVAAFAADTVVLTNRGEMPVAELQPGDRLPTYDCGTQTLLGIGTRRYGPHDILRSPEFRPMRVSGALFPGQESVVVSSGHCIFYKNAAAQYYFGSTEVLIRAQHLELAGFAKPELPRNGIDFFYLLMDRHALVMANGIWAETLFFNGITIDEATTFDTLPDVDLATLHHEKTARPVLHRHESAVLLGSAKPLAKPKQTASATVTSLRKSG